MYWILYDYDYLIDNFSCIEKTLELKALRFNLFKLIFYYILYILLYI